MSEEVRAKALEPFFTTKDIGKGSGLGLSQVLGFAQQSGGGVSIDSRVGKGTSIHIYLPRSQAEAEAAPSGARAEARAASVYAHILLVDDDSAVREITAAMLRDSGFEVTEAGSGGAALDLIQRISAIDLLLIDFAMPGMSGAEVAKRVRTQFP